MLMLMEELCMQILLWVLRLTDAVMGLFNSLVGVSTVESSTGESGTLVDMTFGSSSINTIFWSVIVLAVMLLALFSIIAIIRNMIKNDKRISDIIGKILISVIGMFAVMAIVILAMAMVDELIVLFADILQLDPTLTFSQILFDACVPEGGWNAGYSIYDFDPSMKVGGIMGDYKSSWGIWPKSWKGNGLLADPDEFYYVPALVGSIVTLVYLFIATVNLGKRVFELVYLYFCMPAAMAVLPLDDGARIKNWTEAFTARMVIVFGAMLSVSIFYLLMPIISTLKIPGLGNFGNAVFMVILVVSGAAFIPMGGRLFERIFVSREEAFFDGHNSGLMTVYRGTERFVKATEHMTMKTLGFGWRQATKGGGSGGGSSKSSDTGAYRESVGAGYDDSQQSEAASSGTGGTYTESQNTESSSGGDVS